MGGDCYNIAVLFSLITNDMYIFVFGLLNIGYFLWSVHSKILPIFKNQIFF